MEILLDASAIMAIIEWILSEQGQYIIEKTGYVTIKNRRAELCGMFALAILQQSRKQV
jgi:hypothetical protein